MDFPKLMGLAGGHAEARAIQVALKLGFFEALQTQPLSAASLAAELHCDARATMLLANALVALGLLLGDSDAYSLTEASRKHLVESSPEYLGGMIGFDEALWSTWERLEDSIRNGTPARRPDMFQSRPEDTARFIRAMDSLVRARGDALWTAEHIDLGTARTIVDLGGGPGTYLVEFLRHRPALHGAIYDLQATLEVTRQILAERVPSLLGRIDLRNLDYNRDEIPGPVDVIFMSNIIHSEDEAANAALMAKCYRALAPGGLVIVKDHIMNRELTEPAAGAVFALYLLLTTHGRDYSFDEVAGWLRKAGFTDIRIETLPSPPFTSAMVLARK